MNMRRALSSILPPLIVFIVAAVAIEGAVKLLHIKPYNLPPPSRVFEAMYQTRNDLFDSLISTAKAAAAGFAVSAIVGIALAVFLSTSRLIQRAFYPYTVFFQTVPIIAIAPL